MLLKRMATDAQVLNGKALLGYLYKYEGNGLSDFRTFGLSSPRRTDFEWKGSFGYLYKYEGNGLSDFRTFGLSSPHMFSELSYQ